MDPLLLLSSLPEKIIIAGYASVVMKDLEGHIISHDALRKGFDAFMQDTRYANLNYAHTNIQVGVVLKAWTSPTTGVTYKSRVDDTGLFIVAELRTDHTVAKHVAEQVLSGELASFSISGIAKDMWQEKDATGSMTNHVDGLELYEITVCEVPMNPGSHFQVLKQARQDLEGTLQHLQRAIWIDVGITASVLEMSVSVPTEPWLKQSLKNSLGREALKGSYQLMLTAYDGTFPGITIDKGIVGLSLAEAPDVNFVIRAGMGTKLGRQIKRAILSELPAPWDRSAKFTLSREATLVNPLFDLKAQRTEV